MSRAFIWYIIRRSYVLSEFWLLLIPTAILVDKFHPDLKLPVWNKNNKDQIRFETRFLAQPLWCLKTTSHFRVGCTDTKRDV